MSSAVFIDGLAEIADRYDHFIIDIFGVIHDGLRPFPGTIEALSMLKETGKQTCLLSNSPRRVEQACDYMRDMGISRDLYDHAVTSGEATYQFLKTLSAPHPNPNPQGGGNKTKVLGNDCWFIGNGHGAEVLQGQDLQLVDGPEAASFILNSIPGTEGSAREKLMAQLRSAADRGLPMICANPDLVVNIGSAQHECAGTFALAYEGMGGSVIYHGKPHAPVYEMCYELLGRPDKRKICAIGDSFHTDITGANGFGIDSIMNLVGIHWDEISVGGRIDHVKMRDMLAKASTHPTAMMAGFKW